MSSVKSSSSTGEKDSEKIDRRDDVIKMGYLKKWKVGNNVTQNFKTLRKKFFVLRADPSDSSDSSARLEYYDSEKKWKSHHAPKRTIRLKTCFNINRRLDKKHKHVIALYTKDDCFCLVLESEEDLEAWLKALLSLQHGEEIPDGEQPKPTFEHVWQVTVQKRGLGNIRNILGQHLLCLTDKTLSLVKMTQEEKAEAYEFSLMSIRRCGHSECFFYMEVGRSSCTGAGDLWMQTEDPNIAQNMHDAILHAMSNNSSKEEITPRTRTRSSSSATEGSKPISVTQRRQTTAGMIGGRPVTYTQAEDPGKSTGVLSRRVLLSHPGDNTTTTDSGHFPVCTGSLPGSSYHHQYHHHHHYHHHQQYHARTTPQQHPSQRRHSVSAMCVSTTTITTTGASVPGCSHQRTHSLPLSEPAPGPSLDARRGSTGRVSKRANASLRSTTGGRDRSDSMPSRPRTTSEGGHHPPPLPHPARTIHLVPGHGGPNRPHSMYSRGISYSPPVGSSPVSPASGACSTDSAGSSLSIDEGEGWAEEGVLGLGRYGHSLTPDEPVILEENCDEYVAWTGGQEGEEKLNYLPMDRSTGSLSLPITTTTTLAGSSVGSSGPLRKLSPNLSSSGFKSESPSQGSYMDMYSPYSSSPLDTPGGYMAMSPGGALNDISVRNSPFNRAANSANHSRGSSLAEETSDGYVPMAPNLSDDGYVGMDQVHHGIPGHINHDYHGSEMSPGSSCSITSGTPSTDLRFSEYHLEKVSSYFTPSEEEETSSLDRPIRAYSVGSRPDHMKKVARPEIVNQTDAARVRAFSVGSRSKLSSRLLSHDGHTARQHPGPALTPPTPHHLHSSSGGSKSLSAPLLSHSWSGSSGLRHTPGGSNHSSCEPMDDLMELDFSHHNHHHHRGNTSRTNKQNSSSSNKTPFRSSALPPPGPQGANHDRLSVPHSSAKIPVTAGPYVEMKASLSGDLHATSPPKFRSANVSPKTSLVTGPYVEMKPGVGGEPMSSNILPLLTSPQSLSLAESEVKLQNVPISTSSSPPKRNLPATSLIGDAPYFDTRAKPVCLATSGSSPKSSGMYIETRAGTSPRQNNPAFDSFQNLKPANVGPYVEMKPGPGVENGVHHTAFPAVGKVRKPTSPIQEEYMDMTLGRQPLEEENDVNEPMSSRLVSTRTAPVDTPQPKKPPEGYVDMSWGSGSKLISKFGLEGYKPQIGEAEEDYMSVDFQAHGDSGSRRRERRGSRKEKNRHSSQPISIQSSGTLKDSIAKTSSSNSPVFSLSGFMAASGRKLSTGTPPKVPPGFLPLGGASSSPGSSPFSSLRRTRNRVQNSHKNDGENDMKSGIVTPTGSNVAIFPFSLNSPGSPMKSFPGNQETKPSSALKNDSYKSSRKCPVDATSGTVKISYPYSELRHPEESPDTSALTSGSSSSSEQPTPVNTKSMNEITKGVDAKDHDYVNYNPSLSSKENLIIEKEYPGYTVMKPVPMVSTRKISAPTFGICRPQQGLSSLALSSPSLSAEKSITPPTTRKSSPSALFQPISKLNEQSPPPRVITSSPIINQGAAMFNKQRSVDSDPGSSGRQSTGKKQISEDRKKDGSPAYENLNLLSGGSSGNVSPLVVSSRPPSVSSGNVSPLVVSSRPPSVSSERELHYASLDLAPSGSEGEDGNRSPRGLKSQSSLTESSTSSSSPNPSIHGGTSDTFTYAEINFAKSEGLKNTSRKMRH